MSLEPLARLRAAVDRIDAATRLRPDTGLSHDADHQVGTFGAETARGFGPFPLLWAPHETGARDGHGRRRPRSRPGMAP